MTHKLENYLRTYRKRAGLSQDELAYLLGTKSGSKISRHERYVRQPGLTTALAYEVIFRVSVRRLFAGLYEDAERRVGRRAGVLSRKLTTVASTPLTSRKVATLEAIIRRANHQ